MRGERSIASRIDGMRDAQLANAKPLRMKTAYTARVARRTVREAGAGGTGETAGSRRTRRGASPAQPKVKTYARTPGPSNAISKVPG